jgi:ornithine decarboxylase antizyme 1
MPINRRRPSVGTLYTWVPGLGSAPDVPHAVNASARKTEGSGVGVTKEPPVSVRAPETGRQRSSCGGNGGGAPAMYGNVNAGAGSASAPDGVSSLCFNIRLIGQEVIWETLLIGRTLFIEIPADILPEGSKESFVTLLEYAEEVLFCSQVIVCFKKNRVDRASLIRTFMFLGFMLVAPGQHQLAVSGDLMYLAYAIQPDSCASTDESDSD